MEKVTKSMSTTHRLAGRRILVVEEEWLIAYDLVELLEAAGAIVVGPVSSVPAALHKLSTLERLPDCASLDFQLAEGTSITIAEELDRLGVPFIFTTGAPELIPEPYKSKRVCPKPVCSVAWFNALAKTMDNIRVQPQQSDR